MLAEPARIATPSWGPVLIARLLYGDGALGGRYS